MILDRYVLCLSRLGAVWSMISLILIFVFVVALAYYATKFVAKYQTNSISQKSNIKVIESFRIANNKFIAIVKICDAYYALSVGKDEMHLIDKLDFDKVKDFQNTDSKVSKKFDFKEILSQVRHDSGKDSVEEQIEKKDQTK
ncbi:MAG: flagellar biosynthetic protein FliO [Lachnospiraceae bacterium]|nr:flagellar biosynthetic protein FliO [Lachnospiraceae bacterium]